MCSLLLATKTLTISETDTSTEIVPKKSLMICGNFGGVLMLCELILIGFQSLKPPFNFSQLQSTSVAVYKPHNTRRLNWG